MRWPRFLGQLTKQLGIDLGTANTRVYVKGKGVVINEPSVVAINRRTGQVMAVGEEARSMVGKNPAHIQVSKPLQRGIIADFEVTEKLLRYFFEKVHEDKTFAIPRPRVVIGVPLDVTEVERKAVADAATGAGAREVLVVESPIAAAIGANLPIKEPVGNMVINLGAGSTEIAVISLNGIVAAKSIAIAGDELNRNIIQYARDVFNLLLGERVAEEIKIAVGSAEELTDPLEVSMRGRDLLTGLPRQIMVNDAQIREALGRSVKVIVDQVKGILETTPPELVADIQQRGIVLTGGGALLRGIDQALTRGTGLPVRVADEAPLCVVRGAGMLLDDPATIADVAISATDIVKGV
ncbi:MAG TPA: rod shape-determining protein [Verrucomicrobiae bacterium]|nr:rod shape-determining protein [Verrucomicrobiae bacterium]